MRRLILCLIGIGRRRFVMLIVSRYRELSIQAGGGALKFASGNREPFWLKQSLTACQLVSDVFIPWPEDKNAASLASYQFRNSRWFRRGWTLQELLAPRKLIFFSRSWMSLGTRTNLWTHVSAATGIKHEIGWEVASVAQKMSWASKRETTRSEDSAYSLMGLFGVNM